MASESASPAPATAAQPGRQIRLALTALFLLGVVVQFYLAGRGVFRASSDFDAHKTVGDILHLVSIVILLASIAIPATRNRVDIGLAFALFVLMTIQVILGDFEHPELGALHPVNALLVMGAAGGIVSRDRRLLGAPAQPRRP
jgi:uncharacterized protein DUF6220